jgi:hypothetical protein
MDDGNPKYSDTDRCLKLAQSFQHFVMQISLGVPLFHLSQENDFLCVVAAGHLRGMNTHFLSGVIHTSKSLQFALCRYVLGK